MKREYLNYQDNRLFNSDRGISGQLAICGRNIKQISTSFLPPNKNNNKNISSSNSFCINASMNLLRK